MNFKLIFVILFLLSSCGLKTRPKAPTGTLLPSLSEKYSKEYSQKPKPKTEEEKKKEKK